MKTFRTTLYITNPGEEEQEVVAPQEWTGEDIDEASEKARQVYELWFGLPDMEGVDYRVGEFVEKEEDNG